MIDFRELFQLYKLCCVRLIVEKQGDEKAATGFHVGNGVLVTAGHVLEDTDLTRIERGSGHGTVEVDELVLAPDPEVDLAVLSTDFSLHEQLERTTYYVRGEEIPGTERHAKYIPLGGHFDEWVGDEFVMSQVLVLGYPSVPMTWRSGLLALCKISCVTRLGR